MTAPISDLQILLSSMSPVRNRKDAAYVHLPGDQDVPARIAAEDLIGFFREQEGLTLIIALDAAERLGLPIRFRAAWITLDIHSDLAAVGLTAAFARALGDAGISCNVVAAACHDHVFVPLDEGDRALAALKALQRRARTAESGPVRP